MKGIRILTTDLLQLSLLRRLVRLPFYQFLFVLPATVVFVIAALSIFFGVKHAGSNFGMVFTWVVWWGLLIGLFLVLGRGWCLMCPFGAFGEWLQRLSLWRKRQWGLGLNLQYPRRLKNLWLALAIFIVFIFLDSGYGMSNSPTLTAGLIVVMTLGPIWVGMLFERRTFCLYLCPLTLFLGIASMVAPFEIRRKDAEVCRKCVSKACFNGSEKTYGCPTFEYQGRGMDKNKECILCAECIRSCPHDNIAMRFRMWGHDLWARKRGQLDEAVGAVTIAGLVTTVSLFLVVFLPPLHSAMNRIIPAGDWARVISIGLLFLGGVAVTWLLMYGFSALSRLFSGAREMTVKSLFVHFGYAAVPLGIMKFLADITDHVLRTWGAIFDVTRALFLDFPLNRIAIGAVTVRQLLQAEQTYVLQVVLLALGFLLSLYVAHKLAERQFADRETAFRAFLPIGAFLFILTMAALWALSAAI